MAIKRSFIQRIVRRAFYAYYARNMLFELQMRARSDSADYAVAHMTEAVIFEDAKAFHLHCLARAPEGEILEFGVASGQSINRFAAAAPGKIIHGFDSFEGLPEDWTGHVEQRGAFSQKGKLPKVASNVRLYKGWFKDTIGDWLSANPGPVGFVHVDCDIYASTRDVLWALRERLQVGSIILFDEYFNYPNWRQHEAKALKEFVEEFGVSYRYVAMTALAGAVAIEILSLGPSGEGLA